MNSFTISQLEQFSGIKAHTIRIWERRYQALSPNRTEGNTRFYENSQLRRLLNIVSLTNEDYKISQLCRMSDELLFQLINEKLLNKKIDDPTSEYLVSQLVLAAIHFDEIHFEKMFSSSLDQYGMKQTYMKVIYPFLNRIGLMWASDSLSNASEHFASNLIRQKLFSAINAFPSAKDSKINWLIFTPENEFHEMGILISHYLIRQTGKSSLYLGCNVPKAALINTIKEVSPLNIYFFLIHHNQIHLVQNYLNHLKMEFPNTLIHISGNHQLISQLVLGNKINWIRNMEDLEQKLV